jgi:hypothetical protein
MCVGLGEKKLGNSKGAGRKRKEVVIDIADSDEEEEGSQPPRKVARSKYFRLFSFVLLLKMSDFVAEKLEDHVRFAEAGPSTVRKSKGKAKAEVSEVEGEDDEVVKSMKAQTLRAELGRAMVKKRVAEVEAKKWEEIIDTLRATLLRLEN